MRTYKRKNGVVPHNIMMQVRYKIADYDRLLQERDRILHGSGEPANGMAKVSGVLHSKNCTPAETFLKSGAMGRFSHGII